MNGMAIPFSKGKLLLQFNFDDASEEEECFETLGILGRELIEIFLIQPFPVIIRSFRNETSCFESMNRTNLGCLGKESEIGEIWRFR